MPATPDTSFYDLPSEALIGIAALRDPSDSRAQLVGQLRDRIEKGRAAQQEWARRFDRLYDEALRSGWNEPFLVQWAAALLEKYRAALELFHPMIESLQSRAADYVSRHDTELLEACQATMQLILGWTSPYQLLCGKLLELAAERRAAPSTVLRARPVAGEIDYGELSREHIARYPKIRARLAE